MTAEQEMVIRQAHLWAALRGCGYEETDVLPNAPLWNVVWKWMYI